MSISPWEQGLPGLGVPRPGRNAPALERPWEPLGACWERCSQDCRTTAAASPKTGRQPCTAPSTRSVQKDQARLLSDISFLRKPAAFHVLSLSLLWPMRTRSGRSLAAGAPTTSYASAGAASSGDAAALAGLQAVRASLEEGERGFSRFARGNSSSLYCAQLGALSRLRKELLFQLPSFGWHTWLLQISRRRSTSYA